MILRDADRRDYKRIKALFLSAFPSEERPPFFTVKLRAQCKKARMLIAEDNGDFIGFAYLICLRDMAYLFFLAISDDMRGRGYGSQVLQLLRREYTGGRLFLAREQLDAQAPNYAQRLSRHSFYIKNGFTDWNCQIKEVDVVYDVMGIGDSISATEYNELITAWAGRLWMRLIDMRLIDNTNVNANK